MLPLLDFLYEVVLLDLLINCDYDGKFGDGLLAWRCFIRAVSFGLSFTLNKVCLVFIFILGEGGFAKIIFR